MSTSECSEAALGVVLAEKTAALHAATVTASSHEDQLNSMTRESASLGLNCCIESTPLTVAAICKLINGEEDHLAVMEMSEAPVDKEVDKLKERLELLRSLLGLIRKIGVRSAALEKAKQAIVVAFAERAVAEKAVAEHAAAEKAAAAEKVTAVVVEETTTAAAEEEEEEADMSEDGEVSDDGEEVDESTVQAPNAQTDLDDVVVAILEKGRVFSGSSTPERIAIAEMVRAIHGCMEVVTPEALSATCGVLRKSALDARVVRVFQDVIITRAPKVAEKKKRSRVSSSKLVGPELRPTEAGSILVITTGYLSLTAPCAVNAPVFRMLCSIWNDGLTLTAKLVKKCKKGSGKINSYAILVCPNMLESLKVGIVPAAGCTEADLESVFNRNFTRDFVAVWVWLLWLSYTSRKKISMDIIIPKNVTMAMDVVSLSGLKEFCGKWFTSAAARVATDASNKKARVE